MNKVKQYGSVFIAIGSLSLNQVSAQITTSQLSGKINTITTAVPFLMIAPDSRGGGMGDIGAATTPDANSIYWNMAKLGFAEKQMGLAISYTPWLRALVPDISLSYLSGYYKLKKDQTISGSLRYFSLGDITFTDIVGTTIGQFRPNEFALDFGYARKLSERWSGGMTLRYIHSNLTGGIFVQGASTHAGNTIASDISAYYQNKDIKLGEKKSILSFGLNISNLGAKISYTSKADRDFIPINLKLGGGLTTSMNEANTFGFYVDLNKLLVPSPPIYGMTSTGQKLLNPDGTQRIVAGMDPKRGVAEAFFSSLYDAPGTPVLDPKGNFIFNSDSTKIKVQKGSVLKEELKEINFSLGMEWWYDKQFAFRFGYFHEDPTKGARQFFTVGLGLRYNVFGLDFAYLIPTATRNPLANTLRFTLTFDFDTFKSQNKENPDSK